MQEQLLNKPWWTTDTYTIEDAVPSVFSEFAGPQGVAAVRAFNDGRTDKGWGLPRNGADPSTGFMHKYTRRLFTLDRVLPGYKKGFWQFAYVMRSMSLVCVDIDGKNGGFQSLGTLGPLPPTLTETSKSGDGLHLFYWVDDVWDAETGFGRLHDRIGIVQGVDIRATGCVYHWPQQRWNERRIAKIPTSLEFKLVEHAQKISAQQSRITTILNTTEDHEVLMMQDDLKSQLAQPIPAGRRNNSLFAIGSQMKLAGILDWDSLVLERALALGLDQAEADKLVNNITTYA